ncbi:MAG: beta-N-acetylhexosaminidase [Deltaproteobacteria bacterium]|nr:beta-N-acetylhexosaminidase [Deltaproteobacteria bacterium]
MKELRSSPWPTDEIGQLFMAGMPGPRLDERTVSLIRDFNLGGVILFARNIEDPLQVARLCLDIQECAAAHDRPSLFLAVDQEGGRVARLREPFTPFPGNSVLAMDAHPVEKALEFGSITAREMKLVGLNMNLAPVVDVQRGEIEKHLAGRSFGTDPQQVALLGRMVVRALQGNEVMAVAKHFPGLGRTSLDPHHHLPRIDVDRDEMEEVNLPPFKAAIEEGVSGIMSSHAVYPALDGERPATLSPKVLRSLLREEMGFNGLVITDDLEMGAISKQWSVAEGAVSAFEAGADILLICKEQENVLESMGRLKDRFSEGAIPLERLRESHDRIREAKARFLGAGERVSLRNVEGYFHEVIRT